MPVVLKRAEIKLTAIIEPSDKVFAQYAAEFERFSQSPNRAAHTPFIHALRGNPTPGARALFES